ncbi:HAD family hydrolase [Thermodesulfobacteriota bacterium]
MIRLILFDFGGVLAEEGFREGLMEIGIQAGLDGDFYSKAAEIVYGCGYVVGRAGEDDFWNEVKQQTGLQGRNSDLTAIILDRFVIRPRMIDLVRTLRRKGFLVAILSDQSDWLDILDGRSPFFSEFHAVFNSYYLGKSKKEPAIFVETVDRFQLQPQEALFVDDNAGHIRRAAGQGLDTHHFIDEQGLIAALQSRNLLARTFHD